MMRIDNFTEIKNRPGQEINPPVLSIENLEYQYPDGHTALRHIDLRVASGEKLALVGPNGAGKSTLLLHLNGILTPGSGQIQIDGMKVGPKTLKQVRAAVGLVFQLPDDQLFSPTVFEDVAYGPIYQGLSESEIQVRVDEALTAVGMQNYRSRVSHHLSTGEKKRIAIATVLSMQPSLLALDEPSAGLDPRARRSLIHLLDALPQTLIVATHDLALAREILPRTVIMDEGQIVADGPTGQILEDQDLLEAHGLE